jgi:hypothetical protein
MTTPDSGAMAELRAALAALLALPTPDAADLFPGLKAAETPAPEEETE